MLRRLFTFLLKAVLPVAVIAAGLGSYSYLKSTKKDVPQRTTREKVWPVRTVPVRFSDYQPTLRLYGKTASGRHVELRALVSGEVIETGPNLKEGAEIKKGDLILKIDPFSYEGALTEAKANLTEAKAKLAEHTALIRLETQSLNRAKEQLALAERNLARAEPLAKKGTVSQQVADERRLTVSQRHQAMEQSSNNIAMQQARAEQQQATITRLKWKVNQAERNLADTMLYAPFNAYVNSVNAEQGRLLGTNDSVVTLLDKDWIDAKFTLSDSQYGRILAANGTVIGREVDIKWFVGKQPFTYRATVERVKAEISSENGGVAVYARIKDPSHPSPIRAGAFVQVDVPDRSYTQVARLPQTALYGQNKIYVIEDERLRERIIEVVGSAGKEILVRGSLKEGTEVLVTRLSTAGDGVKVRVNPDETPTKKTSSPKSANTKGNKKDHASAKKHISKPAEH